MHLDLAPDGRRLVIAVETAEEAATLARVPAWAARARAWSPTNLPMLVIDADTQRAVLGEWPGGNGLPPLIMISPPLAGISRAAGLKQIFEALDYLDYRRPFGHETTIASAAYIAAHGIDTLAAADAHLAGLGVAVGIAAPRQPHGTVWNIHAPITPAAPLASAATRVIQLVRDPRDMVVSAYFFFKRQAENAHAASTDRAIKATLAAADFAPDRKDAAFAALIAEGYRQLSPGGYTRLEPPRPVLESVIRWQTHPRVFTLRYERQHRDPHAQYRALAAWLAPARAVADAVIELAVTSGTFAHQSGGSVAEGQHDEAPRAASPTGHLRKGIVGDWRTHFSPAVRRAFHDQVGDLLLAAGFESDPDWWR
ncbi:MAG: sulfotransferase domain-containing protein [Rhodospirillaceae bacterium]|nr:sulfotransferase domain-containing protein [Rhodospirillaceae bacterium]